MKNNVQLIAVTKPLIEGVNSAEEFICYTARVSNPSNQMNHESSPRLLKYLAKNKHWSPFEHVTLTFEINTTRDIGRQILRHRSFVFQEFSQRYADPTSMEFELREARLQDSKNRQNSIEVDDKELLRKWHAYQNRIIDKSKEAYTWAIENGIAKEQARCVLPEGNTSTRMYMTGNLRNFIHYCQLRTTNGTQKEHRSLAILIKEEILKQFPSLEDIFTE